MEQKKTVIEPVEAVEKDDSLAREHLLSGDLVIGLIGYAGAGCTDVYKRLKTQLSEHGFAPSRVKLSRCIAACSKTEIHSSDSSDGENKLKKAIQLQNLGDKLRLEYGGQAVASLSIKEIKKIRSKTTYKRKAIIIDSLKHPSEVDLYRTVYENSFLLLGIYCGKDNRLSRLEEKFFGAKHIEINKFMERDAKDPESKLGQQVRKAFHQADFFLDNSTSTKGGHTRGYDEDLERFVRIMDGSSLIRPNSEEIAMYYAYAASLKSSCLSRQVGAALTNGDGQVVATGTNEVPAFNGGVYHDGHDQNQNRCFKWEWWNEDGSVPLEMRKPCCHNTRLKNQLKKNIAEWMQMNFPEKFVEYYRTKNGGEQGGLELREPGFDQFIKELNNFFEDIGNSDDQKNDILDKMPGIGDLIEYSRSIHAEMDALLSALRTGTKIEKGSLFVTTYPCHNCARHLVSAGIKEVRFLEPYDKSLAVSLHWDSIENEGTGENAMSIRPYTGIGPRVYEKYFLKRGEVKDKKTGLFIGPQRSESLVGVRLLDLDEVEDRAIGKMPDNVSIDI